MSNITIDKPASEQSKPRGCYAQFGCETGYLQFDWTTGSDVDMTVNGRYTADARMCRVLSAFLENRWRGIQDDELHAAYVQAAQR